MAGKNSKSRAARKPVRAKTARRSQKDLGPRDGAKIRGGYSNYDSRSQVPSLPGTSKSIIPCI
jgi:hypothetical protein